MRCKSNGENTVEHSDFYYFAKETEMFHDGCLPVKQFTQKQIKQSQVNITNKLNGYSYGYGYG